MRVIATRNNSILSKAIRWIFKEPASHIALVFDNDRWLVHSNLLGVNIRLFKNFMSKSGTVIVDSLDLPMNLEQEESVFQSLLENTSEDDYDFPGFFYFGWRGFLFRLFKIPLPAKNKWGKVNLQICTDMISNLPTWLTNLPNNVDLGITTPWRATQILRAANGGTQ